MSPLVQSLVIGAWVDLLLPAVIALYFWWRLAVHRRWLACQGLVVSAAIAFIIVVISLIAAVLFRHISLYQVDWQVVSYYVFLVFMHGGLILYLHSVLFPIPLNYTTGDEVMFGVLYCLFMGMLPLTISGFWPPFLILGTDGNNIRWFLSQDLAIGFVAIGMTGVLMFGIVYFLSRRKPTHSRHLGREDIPTNRVTLLLLIAGLLGVAFLFGSKPLFGFISPHKAVRGWIYEMDFGTGVNLAREKWGYTIEDNAGAQPIIRTPEQREEFLSRMEPGHRVWVEEQQKSILYREYDFREYEEDMLVWRTDAKPGLLVPGLSCPVTREAFEAKYGPGVTSKLPQSGSYLEQMILSDAGDGVGGYETVVYKIGSREVDNLALVFQENGLISAFCFVDYDYSLGPGIPLIPLILFIVFYSSRKKQHIQWAAREAAEPPAE